MSTQTARIKCVAVPPKDGTGEWHIRGTVKFLEDCHIPTDSAELHSQKICIEGQIVPDEPDAPECSGPFDLGG